VEIEIKLLELMAKNNIRQIKQLSKKSKVSEQTISNFLNGKNKAMRLETIAKLCKALNCELGELIIIKKGGQA
jgi:putative transcriptional regulator